MSYVSMVWNWASKATAEKRNDAVLDSLTVFGPDDRSTYSNGEIALGRGLTQLLPEDIFDRQPLWTPDKSACMVAEVRLDNREELIRELNLTQPELLADSAILCAAWQRWGERCLDHMVGGFAFVVWLPRERKIFAARDHSGERTLSYHQGFDFFAIASMPQGLKAIEGVGVRLYDQIFADWIILTQPERDKTFFEGIHKLPPGHLLRYSPGKLEVAEYWNPTKAKPIRFRKDRDYAEGLVEVLDRATKPRLRTREGIASQLSSGLDSSSVTASAAILLAKEGRRITSYTSVPQKGFESGGFSSRFVYDEGPYAAQVAAMYPNVDHVLLSTEGMDMSANATAMSLAMGEPLLNPVNGLWSIAIASDARRRGCRVLFHGSYGNATLSYDSMSVFPYLFQQRKWIRLIHLLYRTRLKRFVGIKEGVRASLEGTLIKTRPRVFAGGSVPAFYATSAPNPDFAVKYGLEEVNLRRMNEAEKNLEEDRALMFSRFDFAPIHSAVRALTGMDMRDPAGDKRVWEYSFGIPLEQLAAGGHLRSLARRAMRGRLPEETLERYKDGTQASDWYLTLAQSAESLKQELSRIEQSPAAQRMLDLPRLRTLLNDLPTGDFSRMKVLGPWNFALTRGISAGAFIRRHDPEAPPLR